MTVFEKIAREQEDETGSRLVGSLKNTRGEWYTLWQTCEGGEIFWNLTPQHQKAPHCAYKDLPYLLKLKGF